MVLVYHGTSVGRGIQIARTGAILSPLEQTIDFLRRIYHENPQRKFEDEYHGKTIEEVALEHVSSIYREHEIEYRAKSVTISTELWATISYAMKSEMRHVVDDFFCKGNGLVCWGGLILAVDVDSGYLDSLTRRTAPHLKYVPDRLSIGNLKELHLSPMARISGKAIKQAFAKYNPVYFDIKE
jgi:hypothetical protein